MFCFVCWGEYRNVHVVSENSVKADKITATRLDQSSQTTQKTSKHEDKILSRSKASAPMETFKRIPKMHDEIPALRWMFPFQYERDWEVSWELDFCKDSLLMVVSLSAAYCFLCFAGRRIMRDLKPFNLKVALALWNLGLAMFSAIGAFRTVPFLINTIYRRGVYHSVCAPPTLHYGHGPVALWVLLFIFSKVPELLDTAFIVLRKKPLIFLHWYHHVTVLLFCWHAFATLSPSGIYFVAMNYSVHAVMYFYYFLTACGYRPPWARLVTIFQLSQMGVGVAVCGLNVYYMKQGVACSMDPDNLKWCIIMYSSYFALFLKFFIERYLLQSIKKPATAAKKTQMDGNVGSFAISIMTDKKDIPETHIKLADPNEDTYFGRVRKTFYMLDFRTAFTTEKALEDAQEQVSMYRRGNFVDPVQLEHAQYVTNAILHPDTGQPVLTPLRASMIVPMNMIMDGAMLLANSTKTTIFAQWLNQTYNALHYYANRNASNEDTTQQRLVAYVGATASSVGASLGIRRLVGRMEGGKWTPAIARMGPFAAVAAADLINMAVMRQSEYRNGVHVYDENGDHVGKSKRCGALAVASCVAGRIFAAAPILLLPPLVISGIEKHSKLFTRPKTRWLRVPALLGLVGCAIQFSVPLTFGLFRQTAQLDCKYLEPGLQQARRKQDGQPVRIVTYNKGI